MATISRSWTDPAQIIGAGDAWVTLAGTAESLSNVVDLASSGYEGAHVVVEIDFDSTPTDDVDVSLYGSLDGSDFDDTPLSSFRVDKDTDPHQVSFIVRDLAEFRIGVAQTGSTDSHNARAYYRAWTYNAA